MKKIIEHILMAIIAWLLWWIFYLLFQHNELLSDNKEQQDQFMLDREFYYSWMTNILSSIRDIDWKVSNISEQLEIDNIIINK